MNYQKLAIIAAAIAINCAVLVWFHLWSVGALAHAAAAAAPTGTQDVITLPVTTVRPSRAQLESLRRERQAATSAAAARSGGAVVHARVMPHDSFADGLDAAGNG